MKYDPISLFTISVVETKKPIPDVFLGVNPELIKYVNNKLIEAWHIEDKEHAMRVIAAAIIEYAYKEDRKN
mgnify:CR=1 FL=1